MNEFYQESKTILWFLGSFAVISMFMKEKTIVVYLLILIISMLMLNPTILKRLAIPTQANTKKGKTIFGVDRGIGDRFA